MEKVVVKQTKDLKTSFYYQNPESPESGELFPVQHIQELTPYGMLLISIGSCTAMVLNTYARARNLDLEEVEAVVKYERIFKEDCEHCAEIKKYGEQITLDLKLSGSLDARENEKLFRVALQCPIHKMLRTGIKLQMRMLQKQSAKK